MMNTKLTYWLLLSGLLVLKAAGLSAQDNWVEAKKQLKEGQFRQASLSFEYIYFNETDENAKARALLYKASCYQYSGDLMQTARTLDRINENELSDSTLQLVFCEKIRHHVMVNELVLANFLLEKWKSTLNDTIYPNEMLFLEMLIYLKKESWANAKSVYATYLRQNNLSEELLNIFELPKRKRFFKNEKTAAALSLIIPGSGQVYAGKPLKGLISLSLVSLSTLYLVHSIINEYYITTAAAGLTLFTRFYFGGKVYAQKLVRERNKMAMNEIVEPIFLNFNEKTTLFKKEFYFR